MYSANDDVLPLDNVQTVCACMCVPCACTHEHAHTHSQKKHQPTTCVFLTIRSVTDFYACAHLRRLGGGIKAVHESRLSFRALQGELHFLLFFLGRK